MRLAVTIWNGVYDWMKRFREVTDLCHLPKELLEIIKGNLPEGLYAVVALAPG